MLYLGLDCSTQGLTAIVIEIDGDTRVPRVRVASYEGLVLLSDPLDPEARSFVAGPNPAATRVDRLTIRRQVGRALDLGTGAGTQRNPLSHASRQANSVFDGNFACSPPS